METTETTETQASSGVPKTVTLDELRRQHRRLDEQIAELETRPSLTPEEQLQAATMKKRKLALRDQIELSSGV